MGKKLILPKNIEDLIRDEKSIIILATSDENGNPHAVLREDFLVLSDGSLVFAEWRESSYTNRNLVYAIWNNKNVSLLLIDRTGKSYVIPAKPIRFDFFSELFHEEFAKAREKHGENLDVTGLWYLEALAVRDENPEILQEEEEELHPFFRYLDKPSINKNVNA